MIISPVILTDIPGIPETGEATSPKVPHEKTAAITNGTELLVVSANGIATGIINAYARQDNR
ncbi:hypothetical protein [Bacillus sp. AFS040349]|uniref:hypothetical protein n=1 Tax=Bacillus sp. AFS040349 TaxID=2033502 RepID=UPI000BFE29F1|nr:hypothetical protein [Bacillus sp. AFS040349]PGT79590.1 hypothetical protein COD11_22390 [Bacillus sp. AFS040349]